MGIYYISLNFVKVVISNALAKIKPSTHIWIHISSMYVVVDIAYKITSKSKVARFTNISSHNIFPLYSITVDSNMILFLCRLNY